MNESQRGMVTARIATLNRGGDGSNQYSKGANRSIDPLPTQQQAAKLLNVGQESLSIKLDEAISPVDTAAKAVDMNRETYRQAKAVVERGYQ